ncbi:MAG: GTP 3',8-cyclase MoaA [Phycisphaerae bacterium]|nr:GTP 3',8-cyclase MoaA [Phycisphaerae bacterium]
MSSLLELPILDRHARPSWALGPRSISNLRMLRISVTDRCNLKCHYCMPEAGMAFSDKDELLGIDQICEIAGAALDLGVHSIKLPGGEPTVRSDLEQIITSLAAMGVPDLSLTTNGMQLQRRASALQDAGLDRVTVSMDSLVPERFKRLTGGGRLDLVRTGLDRLDQLGFTNTKINVVMVRGVNDDELIQLAQLSLDRDWTIRFIEYMPLGQSRLLEMDEDPLVPTDSLIQRLRDQFGRLEEVPRHMESGMGPAEVLKIPGAVGRIGFIHAMTRPFCDTCNRLRVTARGELRSCLFDGGEIDLLPLLGSGGPGAIQEAFRASVAMKPEVAHGSRGDRAMSQLGG